MSDQDFSNYPKSITEIKSDKSNKAYDATPRDNLIDMLRSIDSKEINPDALVIIWREPIKGVNDYANGHCVASPDGHATIGMVTEFLHRYCKP